ncbi:MAG: heme A synthase [Rhodospirillales bacterium 20-60-12]|nr:MAG: heme A synthase [Rhodospirillales bacterium 20-60-12]HQT66961.1 COX15/CtaA family protein [Acetobacteraceae bacterium]HQU01021.1 COX15/CtaA family protein [Acetobacteraceae bacterium]
MPTDLALDARTHVPERQSGRASSVANRRLVSLWLFATYAVIIVMIGIGGYVQNDDAGLSIMVWQPISGVIPPLTTAAWAHMFALYKTIPQYQIANPHMDLAGFKAIFWPEYIHRMWGRLLGFVFGVPLVWFWLTGRLERRLRPWLALLFALGALQGLIGWFMVSSGFEPGHVVVTPWRLSLHYCAAVLLCIAIFWTALVVSKPTVDYVPAGRAPRRWAIASIVTIALALFAGTFVSGTRAYLVHNHFPLMEGQLIPPDYAALHPFWLNWFANKAAVQWNHRLLGTLTAIVTIGAFVSGLRADLPSRARDAFLAMGVLVFAQYVLGVSTLVSKNMNLGLLHQMNAVLLLSAAVWAVFELRGRAPT